MKFLCIGSGSIGKRHMRNLLTIGINPSDITAIDPRADRKEEVLQMGINNLCDTFEDALATNVYDAAIVCSPTNLHISQGIELAKRNINILMEKPLAHNLEGINELKSLIIKNNITLLMAYIFRFTPHTNKVLELLKSGVIGKVLYVRGEFSEYLPDWHPYEDYRSFYMAEKSQGGGSILDQSHIMDLIHYLFGEFEKVYAINTNLSSLEVNSDDFSELLVKLKCGAIASIHTDMFGEITKNNLRLRKKGNIYWSTVENIVTLYDSDSKKN